MSIIAFTICNNLMIVCCFLTHTIYNITLLYFTLLFYYSYIFSTFAFFTKYVLIYIYIQILLYIYHILYFIHNFTWLYTLQIIYLYRFIPYSIFVINVFYSIFWLPNKYIYYWKDITGLEWGGYWNCVMVT